VPSTTRASPDAPTPAVVILAAGTDVEELWELGPVGSGSRLVGDVLGWGLFSLRRLKGVGVKGVLEEMGLRESFVEVDGSNWCFGVWRVFAEGRLD